MHAALYTEYVHIIYFQYRYKQIYLRSIGICREREKEKKKEANKQRKKPLKKEIKRKRDGK